MTEPSFRDQASLLLANLREGREVRAYLDQFSAADEGCFAVVKVGGALMAQELETLADRLALLQALGLRPVIVFGAGPQLDGRLGAAGIGTERRDGLRVTPAPAMPIVAAETARTGLLLVEAMRARGGNAVLVPPGTITARLLDAERYGHVGEVAGIDEEALRGLLASGMVPLIGCAHLDAEARLLNVNADDVARQVALALRPQKIVFLTGTGGMLDGEGRIVDSINLATDLEGLRAADWVHGGMALKLDQIAQLLSELPLSSSVSMTDANNLVRELFTHGGAGTLIRQGERILTEEGADARALTPLIERAFGRRLRPDYWQRLDAAYSIRTENTRAAAIVTDLGPMHCLDKFAVDPDARGEGLAKAVWARLKARSPRLVWRSRARNPFNAFYASEADGFLRRGFWHVYWYGDADLAAIELGEKLASLPPDFEEAA
ncbi:acetylglutamate kinase [Parvularcula dongshanensis]|uniref:Acetylglutamate kinase n=1 Tax=Parvularcula dongshanensis TaxID=1173995 RepID=A0A840I2K0_9PROT|nr:acetylglutamate kinase [Parvularcula dongshanensis]MBB4658418.1 acetylglutamate kinase [Parvularcula dongshanensis]